MATANEIFGRIGAAKAFTTNLADNIDIEVEENEAQIARLEEQKEVTTDENEKKDLDKQIKKLRKKNKRKTRLAKNAKRVTDFLAKLCDMMSIGIQTIIIWMSKLIVQILPPLEVAVKMLLLTNIKKMLSCAIDPRIPDEWRTNEGVLINELMIDPRQILKASPYSKFGRYNYFGVFYNKNRQGDKTNARPDCELARAEDMNAFLWYVMNYKNISAQGINADNVSNFFNDSGTLYDRYEFQGKDNVRFTLGSTFKQYDNSNTLFMCEKKTGEGSKAIYTILPIGDNWKGVTWYKDRTTLGGPENPQKIDYKKSKPLFNVEYMSDTLPTSVYPDGNFKFRILPKPFSSAVGFVLDLKSNMDTLASMAEISAPAQELLGDSVSATTKNTFQTIQSPFPCEARFNALGNFDKRGIYSINTLVYYVIEEPTSNTENELYFRVTPKGAASKTTCYLLFRKKLKTYDLRDADDKNKEASLQTKYEVLTECYCGKTVYEFNYDYVLSMKLFDAQEVATGIVDSLMNINIPNPLKNMFPSGSSAPNDEGAMTNITQIQIDSYVDKMVEKMIDNEEQEFTDCFYEFNNADYEAMEKEVADKAMNSALVTDTTNKVTEVYDIIGSYNADATLEERIETISTALTKAATVCGYDTGTGNNAGGSTDNGNATEGSSDNYGSSIGRSMLDGAASSLSEGGKDVMTFIQQAIRLLISSIVNSLLTPKVLMLLQVNRMLMGTDALPTSREDMEKKYDFSVQDVLSGLSGLLNGIIKEVINIIMMELLRLILERLSEMMAMFMKRLGLEYAMKWVLLLKQLISCFKFNKTAGSNRINDTQYNDMINNIIDRVDYADIDVLVDEIIPKTNPC